MEGALRRLMHRTYLFTSVNSCCCASSAMFVDSIVIMDVNVCSSKVLGAEKRKLYVWLGS
jgi:hypothetical protein